MHAYMGLSETEKALNALELAYEEYDPWMIYIHFVALLDPLRPHPRFKALLKKLNTPLD